jgi:hypothetical protein
MGIRNYGSPIGAVARSNPEYSEAFGAAPELVCTPDHCLKHYHSHYAVPNPGSTRIERDIELFMRIHVAERGRVRRVEVLLLNRGFSRWYELENRALVEDIDPAARMAAIEWALGRIEPIVAELGAGGHAELLARDVGDGDGIVDLRRRRGGRAEGREQGGNQGEQGKNPGVGAVANQFGGCPFDGRRVIPGPYCTIRQEPAFVTRNPWAGMGNKDARSLLVTASTRFLTHSPRDVAIYAWARNVELRRGKFKSRVALARRLAGVMLAMWKRGEPYRPLPAGPIV